MGKRGGLWEDLGEIIRRVVVRPDALDLDDAALLEFAEPEVTNIEVAHSGGSAHDLDGGYSGDVVLVNRNRRGDGKAKFAKERNYPYDLLGGVAQSHDFGRRRVELYRLL